MNINNIILFTVFSLILASCNKSKPADDYVNKVKIECDKLTLVLNDIDNIGSTDEACVAMDEFITQLISIDTEYKGMKATKKIAAHVEKTNLENVTAVVELIEERIGSLSFRGEGAEMAEAYRLMGMRMQFGNY